MTSEEILFDAEERMEKAIAKLKNDLTGIRSLVDLLDSVADDLQPR